ncbi:hypothetical protein [Halomonas casei]|uniref:hypothetical protein n=1 Tax=Halomonas casei TaxID=2742613 RepID=UPI003CF2A470
MQRKYYMRMTVARGMADALDRIGATVVALSLIGTLFTEQISYTAGTVGVVVGVVTVLFCVYSKAKLDADLDAGKRKGDVS